MKSSTRGWCSPVAGSPGSPDGSSVVQLTIDSKYEDMKRSSSLRWVAVNTALFMVFAYDLWHKCPGYTSTLHYAEGACAAVLLANALLHARRLAAPRRRPPALTPRQRRLLGLPPAAPAPPAPPAPATPPASPTAESVSPSPSPRRWRADASSPPPSPPSPASPPAASAPRLDLAPDEFIADRRGLAEYLRAYERRAQAGAAAAATAAAGGAGGAWGGGGGGGGAARPYQLAAPDAEGAAAEEGGGEAREPHVWRRLRLDPQRLTQWNFNLRLWLHVTILERLVRELAGAEAAAGAGAGGERQAALLPYLQPFADQPYVVRRIKELAAGGCLSAYKWNGGGSEWDESKPPDAELVLRLLAAYLDGQLPPGARSFSAEHLSAAPAPPPRSPRTLAVHRVAARPPHYVLLLAEETVEVARGRNNLLHTLLLLLAAAAQDEPPALRHLHLGRAGLNMLWIIGR